MGIRYLTKIYNPLGEFVDYEKLRNAACFIDGPSLAHCICSDLSSTSVGDPALATEKARRILQRLIDKQIDIRYVVFDGAIPLEKIETKLQRANQDIAKLHNTPSGLILGSFATDMLRETLDEYFPSIPVITVPYEADYAVAGMVKRYAAIFKRRVESVENQSNPKPYESVYLISSDSDFLVYDLGFNVGCVCFTRTKDLEQSKQVFVTYHKEVMDKVGMPLWEAGYVLDKIPFYKRKNLTLSDLSRFKIKKNDPHYHKFKDEFTLKEFKWSTCDEFARDPHILFIKNFLPSCKLSRLHIMLNRHGENLRAKLTKDSTSIFLPVLVEDIRLSTVWAIGRRWRSLAYEILLKKFEGGMINMGELGDYTRPGIVIEYHRNGKKLDTNRIPINDKSRGLSDRPNTKSSHEYIDALKEMNPHDFLKLMAAQIVEDSNAESFQDLENRLYKYFAFIFDLEIESSQATSSCQIEKSAKKPKSKKTKSNEFTSEKSDGLLTLMSSLNIEDIHWNIKKLHLFAQIQALFYSVIFLQQAGVNLGIHVKIRHLRGTDFSRFFSYS
ncbi:hypothetical protein NADFUDRAFT_52849 [Nadsonia fulvescens var. elongata DSM 6958]|uniref:Asteroid domain-containing protein n=1 Tax=Nadsonia fulvescens var. elongata DSM 6958 TaxID=857566 RepID=A0A1E3PEL5_9ASCO|nr:hypothetical protein NADFUDRAFT_52849 [Nadsonia fulvescens var. elongata DSM 6958]